MSVPLYGAKLPPHTASWGIWCRGHEPCPIVGPAIVGLPRQWVSSPLDWCVNGRMAVLTGVSSGASVCQRAQVCVKRCVNERLALVLQRVATMNVQSEALNGDHVLWCRGLSGTIDDRFFVPLWSTLLFAVFVCLSWTKNKTLWKKYNLGSSYFIKNFYLLSVSQKKKHSLTSSYNILI